MASQPRTAETRLEMLRRLRALGVRLVAEDYEALVEAEHPEPEGTLARLGGWPWPRPAEPLAPAESERCECGATSISVCRCGVVR